jgi:hypothetical protein
MEMTCGNENAPCCESAICDGGLTCYQSKCVNTGTFVEQQPAAQINKCTSSFQPNKEGEIGNGAHSCIPSCDGELEVWVPPDRHDFPQNIRNTCISECNPSTDKSGYHCSNCNFYSFQGGCPHGYDFVSKVEGTSSGTINYAGKCNTSNPMAPGLSICKKT